MTDMTRTQLSSMAPPAMISPAEHIKGFTGDPNFMTSLARGLAVIHAFQERKRQLTIAQISHRTEIPRAAVRRCLHTLIKLGYAASNGRTYSLSPKILVLGHAFLSSNSLATTAQPILDRLSEQLHETFSLGALEDTDVLYIARSATPKRLNSVDLNIGGYLPAYCTAMGRVLLATLDEEALEDYFHTADLQVKTSRTLHSVEALRENLNLVRSQGWSLVDQEFEIGLRSLSVPVYNASGEVLAALNVWTQANCVSRQELEVRFLPALLQASKDLSLRL